MFFQNLIWKIKIGLKTWKRWKYILSLRICLVQYISPFELLWLRSQWSKHTSISPSTLWFRCKVVAAEECRQQQVYPTSGFHEEKSRRRSVQILWTCSSRWKTVHMWMLADGDISETYTHKTSFEIQFTSGKPCDTCDYPEPLAPVLFNHVTWERRFTHLVVGHSERFTISTDATLRFVCVLKCCIKETERWSEAVPLMHQILVRTRTIFLVPLMLHLATLAAAWQLRTVMHRRSPCCPYKAINWEKEAGKAQHWLDCCFGHYRSGASSRRPGLAAPWNERETPLEFLVNFNVILHMQCLYSLKFTEALWAGCAACTSYMFQ